MLTSYLEAPLPNCLIPIQSVVPSTSGGEEESTMSSLTISMWHIECNNNTSETMGEFG